ncbi:uncharacterized protein METZ01_LOCUS405886 [marine metagenome]|uniref:DUF218 domain-containing protein n=1 Tax=marine metagenome TaxID=408172 RepID=A0A382W2J2_9ZZZZ
MSRFRLTVIRECRVFTWFGWSLFSTVICLISIYLVLFAYPFLAPTKPIDGEILITEGWLPDYALSKVKIRFQDGSYKFLIITGGNFSIGHPLSKYYKSYANLAASILNAKGFPMEKIILAPITTIPKTNRTYHAALAVKKRLNEINLSPKSIDVVSHGVHSRRTWIIFKKVFSPANVGVVAMEPKDYDTMRWWTSSAGVRDIISEAVAYLYVRWIFYPSN